MVLPAPAKLKEPSFDLPKEKPLPVLATEAKDGAFFPAERSIPLVEETASPEVALGVPKML